MPMIIVISNLEKNFNKAPNQITIKNTTYTLEASVIKPAIDHAIAGLHCNKLEYVYDSLNVITYDHWTDGNIDNYLKYMDNVAFYGLKVLIYIRSDLQDGGNIDYYSKYIKYKTKYLKLQNKINS